MYFRFLINDGCWTYKKTFILMSITAYLAAICIYTLIHYPSCHEAHSMKELLNLTDSEAHDTRLCIIYYLFYLPFASVPVGAFPAGFWVTNMLISGTYWQPFCFFLVSTLLTNYAARFVYSGMPLSYFVFLRLLCGFPLFCYMRQDIPSLNNLYLLPIFFVGSLFAAYTYHFLVIGFQLLLLRNTAHGVLRFLGFEVKNTSII